MLPYIIISGIVFLVIVIALKRSNQSKVRRQFEEIRNRWGQPKAENANVDKIDFERISRYASVNPIPGSTRISAQLTSDIDFFLLFAFLDRTISKIGQQYLFRQLIFPKPAQSSLQKFHAWVEWFSENASERESTQFQLLRLRDRNAYLIANVFQPGYLERTKWVLPPWISLLALGLFAAGTYWSLVFFLLLPLPLVMNMFLHYWNKRNTFQLSKSIPQLMTLIDVAGKTAMKNASHKYFADDTGKVLQSVQQLSALRKKVALVDFSDGGGLQGDLNAIGMTLGELIKGILLIEVFTYNSIARDIDNNFSSIERVFDFVGRIDSAISVASLRAGKLATCQPEFHSDLKMSMKDVVHPLVKNCTANTIEVDGRSVLITGSNMSGKTTFLRTIAINVLLGQTIFTCFASKFESPFLNLSTFIRIDDDVTKGSSYFLQEVMLVKEMVSLATSGYNLFVLDELFKGTNTIERIAAAKAVLSFLQERGNLIFISTHDLELVAMLLHTFDLYHFTETIDGEKLNFDHKLKEGPLRTRNAVNILKLWKYPIEIIEEATEIANAQTPQAPI